MNEWLAVNIVDFFNQINMLYGTITEFCIPEECPVMSAGPKYEYHWCDGVQFKKPIKVSAPEYVDFLMTWVQSQLDDESVFPSKIGVPFPKNFASVVKTISKRLFRVYAHVYRKYHSIVELFSRSPPHIFYTPQSLTFFLKDAHFPRIVALGEEAHLNTSFKHFVFFIQEFDLIDKKELAPLDELIKTLTGS